MEASKRYPRFVTELLREALADSPVVLIHGPRQCGKSTLAMDVGATQKFQYVTFDDEVALAAAQEDPAGFLAGLAPHVIIDEVQRVPRIFMAIKASVDRNRKPGRFLLTGSSNVFLLPGLSDSLAGRMSIVRLHPLAQCEIEGRPPTFIDRLFDSDFKPMSPTSKETTPLVDRIVNGGYPSALARSNGGRAATWYRDYAESIIERDIRNMSRITGIDALPRLLTCVATQTARMLNVSELAGPFEVSRPTLRDYLTLLRRIFLVDELPSWHSNRLNRLVKTAKLHIGDTGLACALMGLRAKDLAADRTLLGQLLETFVVQEISRQSTWHGEKLNSFHYRDKDGVEVDLVLEQGVRALAGVEVKASATVDSGDFRGLKKLKSALGTRFVCGVVLYDGDLSVSFGDRLWAVPIRRLWN